MRLLRGEGLDAVSRDSQAPGHAIEGWKRVCIEHGARGLKSRVEPEERELTLARAKIGELIMRRELAEFLIEQRGLAIRCDWGPQYIADAWINEVRWLGITISPSYVGEPACNGVIERFNRTLTEPCVYLHRFESLEQARALIGALIERYSHEWLIERLGHRTPA